MENHNALANARSAVFKESESLEGKCTKIEGYDFNRGLDYPRLLSSMLTTGFQASNLGDAIRVVTQMVFFFLLLLRFSSFASKVLVS